MSNITITIHSETTMGNVVGIESQARVQVLSALENWMQGLPTDCRNLIKEVVISPIFNHGRDVFFFEIDMRVTKFTVHVPQYIAKEGQSVFEKESHKLLQGELKKQLEILLAYTERNVASYADMLKKINLK